MDKTKTREVTRVKCRQHNVVILESREELSDTGQWSHIHCVSMFTPSPTVLSMVPEGNDDEEYFKK